MPVGLPVAPAILAFAAPVGPELANEIGPDRLDGIVDPGVQFQAVLTADAIGVCSDLRLQRIDRLILKSFGSGCGFGGRFREGPCGFPSGNPLG